jgi:hypothetical protein
MNNFDSPDKLSSIDTAIESVLNANNIDWKNEELHSWGYTTGLEKLDIMTVYGRNGAEFNGVKSTRVDDNISVRYVNVKSILSKKKGFILELSTVLYKNTAPYNIVVSNIAPDPKFFSGHDLQLHSQVGHWYNGLR